MSEPDRESVSTGAGPADRAAGALWGLAIGDALGMPTQLLARELIVQRYGPELPGFLPAGPDHPLAAGLPAGSITDDTEQAVLVGRLLVEAHGRPDPAEVARALLAWHRQMQARGSLDLLGPSTIRAVLAIEAGAGVEESGRAGDTNGAAMRIAPAGLVAPVDDLPALVDLVVLVSKATHHTTVALAGAAAVAAAVSAGVAGLPWPRQLAAALEAAALGGRRGVWVAGADVAARIAWAVHQAARAGDPAELSAAGRLRALDRIARLIGTSVATQESVPTAFAVAALYPDSPWDACRAAAGVGGDCDTIAAITGAISGARHGRSAFPAAAVRTVAEVNLLHLDDLAADLLAVRADAAG